MAAIKTFIQAALSFPEVKEAPHFEKNSFRVNKKIFATLDIPNYKACIKLSPAMQDIFCAFDTAIIYPVPNKWGQQGWTFVSLEHITTEMLQAVLETAYCEVAPKKLAALVKQQ